MSDATQLTPWELTRLISPRNRVRVAAQLVDGEFLNDYATQHWIDDDAPATPWAMYLADDAHRYRFLCFDLDASRGNAAYDAGKLSHWLDELNIEHLLAQSGPAGGRHVWIALSDPLVAHVVRELAQLAAQLLPSLDPTALNNPATGCVRPPGSPHRSGGMSAPLTPLQALTTPTVTAELVDDLRGFLVDAGAEVVTGATSIVRGMAIDADGHPHITGAKRPLSARVAALLEQPPAEDASYTLAIVLAGCAHARWRHVDVLKLVDHSPALEHVRSRRTKGGQRTPRTAYGRARTLAAAWRHAVYYVASNPSDATGDDALFHQRANAAAQAVERAQERADAMPGLWGRDRASSAQRAARGTHSARAVLDALCLYIVQSVQLDVEADVRRLSADTGYSKSHVHRALQTLAAPAHADSPESAWIVRVGEAEAPHGQRYRLSSRFSTGVDDRDGTQVHARPARTAPTPSRSWWINRLSRDLSPLAHDTFAAPHSLGRTAGLIYKSIPEGAVVTVDELTHSTGLDASRVRAGLNRLHSHGLTDRSAHGWNRVDGDVLDAAANELQVAGYLEQRRRRYDVDRGVWGWWQAEYTWMTKKNKKRRRRRTPAGVALFAQNDRPDYARYPRGPGGRADHREARRLVEAGALSPVALAA